MKPEYAPGVLATPLTPEEELNAIEFPECYNQPWTGIKPPPPFPYDGGKILFHKLDKFRVERLYLKECPYCESKNIKESNDLWANLDLFSGKGYRCMNCHKPWLDIPGDFQILIQKKKSSTLTEPVLPFDGGVSLSKDLDALELMNALKKYHKNSAL